MLSVLRSVLLRRFAPFLLLALLAAGRPALAQPYVCIDTNVGEFCMELLEEEAPRTVENFLNYVESGRFDNTFFHRTVPDFIIQGGGYTTDPLGEEIQQDASIPNEFGLSNTRGTVAMAKFDNQPNSATSEWFVNLTDNSATLDFSNGGFTVFARVVQGMDVVDGIGNSQRADLRNSLGGAFGEVPVLRKPETGIGLEDLVLLERAYVAEDVTPDPEEPGEEEPGPEPEEDALYACTADWVAQLAPTQVCFATNMGEFCVDLLTGSAPNTVANFLHYVADRDYDSTLIHRSVQNFVIQGGGYKSSPFARSVPEDDPIANEFNVPNTRGTLAMAKVGGEPDSATSQWFVNLADNSSLDTDNGGFTVFARVREQDMPVIDAIADLPAWNLGFLNDAFVSAPLRRSDNLDGLNVGDFVVVERVYIPGAPRNPCLPAIDALTEFRGSQFSLPVRVGAKLYRVVMRLQSLPPAYVFTVDMSRIVELVDGGQETAVFENGLLTVPSIKVGNGVLTDVVFELTDRDGFEFTLRDYTRPGE